MTERLKKLENNSTQGPWALSFDAQHNRLFVVSSRGDVTMHDSHRLIVCEGGDYAGRNNFELIVEMRNALPILLELVNAALQTEKELCVKHEEAHGTAAVPPEFAPISAALRALEKLK